MTGQIGRAARRRRWADVDRRYPILLATLAETYVEVLDELVQLLDQALAGAESRDRYELSQRVVERARVDIARGRLLDEVLDILADPAVSDADADRLVRARIGMPRLQAARRPAAEREPRDHGHFDLLAARYKYLRTFTPAVIAHLPLTGNTSAQPRNPDLVRNLYASVLAYACNLGYAGMADASGISEDTLAWTAPRPPPAFAASTYRTSAPPGNVGAN